MYTLPLEVTEVIIHLNGWGSATVAQPGPDALHRFVAKVVFVPLLAIFGEFCWKILFRTSVRDTLEVISKPKF